MNEGDTFDVVDTHELLLVDLMRKLVTWDGQQYICAACQRPVATEAEWAMKYLSSQHRYTCPVWRAALWLDGGGEDGDA